jgi:hypothetical protein
MLRKLFIVGPLVALLAIALACESGGGGGGDGPAASPEATVTAEAPSGNLPVSALRTPGVRRAVRLVEAEPFLEQFGGQDPSGQPCDYDAETGTLHCTDLGVGTIELDPPPTGEGVECTAVVLDGELLGVICSSADPPSGAIYKPAD